MNTPLDVLRERGHCKRTVENSAGQVCARGAINIAILGDAYIFAAWEGEEGRKYEHALSKEIRNNYPEYNQRWSYPDVDAQVIIAFNNEPERTQAEVEAMMEKAEINLGLR